MSDRPSRKRKATEEGSQYKEDMKKQEAATESRKKMRVLRKEIDTNLSGLFGKMKVTEQPPSVAVMDVEMGRGRRRKSRKVSKKKSRKTRRRH